jgi:hypothetical protein
VCNYIFSVLKRRSPIHLSHSGSLPKEQSKNRWKDDCSYSPQLSGQAYRFLASKGVSNEGRYAGPNTKLGISVIAVSHITDHYGQLVEYLRLNGIVPPMTEKYGVKVRWVVVRRRLWHSHPEQAKAEYAKLPAIAVLRSTLCAEQIRQYLSGFPQVVFRERGCVRQVSLTHIDGSDATTQMRNKARCWFHNAWSSYSHEQRALVQCLIDVMQFEWHFAEPADVLADSTAAFASGSSVGGS